MIRPPSGLRQPSFGLRPPTAFQPQTNVAPNSNNRFVRPPHGSAQLQQAPTSRTTFRVVQRGNNPVPEAASSSRPSIFPRNSVYQAPTPTLARRTGIQRPSRVVEQDENVNPERYSMKELCEQLGYDYRALVEAKKRIGYTGAGLIVPEQTEVDESLLKGVDMKFGLWAWKYVRILDDPLAENIRERSKVAERIDNQAPSTITTNQAAGTQAAHRIFGMFATDTTNQASQSATNHLHPPSTPPPRSAQMTVRFGRHSPSVLGISDEINRSPRPFTKFRQPGGTPRADNPAAVLKRSQTQLIDAHLDNESFDRDALLHSHQQQWKGCEQVLQEQLERLRNITDPDLFAIKNGAFEAALQRVNKIMNNIDV